jgi:hypothetical protein
MMSENININMKPEQAKKLSYTYFSAFHHARIAQLGERQTEDLKVM